MSAIDRCPQPPLNRVFRGGVELKPTREEDIRLVSNGESYGIQHRSRFLFWLWWSKPIHTGLTLEVAQEHIRRVRAEIGELRKKRRERWYPVLELDGPIAPDEGRVEIRGGYQPIGSAVKAKPPRGGTAVVSPAPGRQQGEL